MTTLSAVKRIDENVAEPAAVAGSEAAFDAAVSALVRSEHEGGLRGVGPPAHPTDRVEGKVWRPQ